MLVAVGMIALGLEQASLARIGFADTGPLERALLARVQPAGSVARPAGTASK